MQAKPILFIIIFSILSYCSLPVIAQTKQHPVNNQRAAFYQLLKQSGLKFNFPKGFQEIKAVNNEDYSFDFALEDPGRSCEAWFMVRSQKQNWVSYERARADKQTELANPDSTYIGLGKAYALTLTGNTNFLVRDMPPEVLLEYNADAGKSYLLNLLDMAVTGHYRYALIVSLQKKHTGTLVAIYFTNYKDTDFYRDVNHVNHSFKFMP